MGDSKTRNVATDWFVLDPTRGSGTTAYVAEQWGRRWITIDTIWETWQETLEPLRDAFNSELGTSHEEWQIPREADDDWSAEAERLHGEWWKARIARQREIDASIAARADQEFLYDKPYVDKARVRVAGPFTVESLSPHREVAIDENDEFVGVQDAAGARTADEMDFADVVMEHLKTAGVQQSAKEDRITFSTVQG